MGPPRHAVDVHGKTRALLHVRALRFGYEHARVWRITDEQTGEAIPYLPVTATVRSGGAAPRTITLHPMVGDQGFHYGADVTLARRTDTLTLAVGPTTMRVLSSAKGRFGKRATAVFDWSAPSK